MKIHFLLFLHVVISNFIYIFEISMIKHLDNLFVSLLGLSDFLLCVFIGLYIFLQHTVRCSLDIHRIK